MQSVVLVQVLFRALIEVLVTVRAHFGKYDGRVLGQAFWGTHSLGC